jgi:hypothetical protein
MLVSLTLCERCETIEVTVVTFLVAMGPDDIIQMVGAAIALSSNGLV